MNIDTSNFGYFFLFRDIVVGIAILVFILIFHGSLLSRVIMRFEKSTSKHMAVHEYNWVYFHFYSAFIHIAMIHLFEIFIWGGFLVFLNLVPNLLNALLFAGSCYTTIGFIEDILPFGWKTLAFFIAFTGLFSLAWTTSGMISMMETFKEVSRKRYKK